MSVGRNELCPCGSGKKYKKCCGVVTPITQYAGVRELQLGKEYTAWIERLQRFVSTLSPDATAAAKREFAEALGLPEQELNQPYWAIHFYNWFVFDKDAGEGTILEKFLQQEGRRMDPLMQQSLRDLTFDAYEIVRVEGSVFIASNLANGEEHAVVADKTVSVKPGQILLCRLLPLGLRRQLFTGSIVAEPGFKQAVNKWLRAIHVNERLDRRANRAERVVQLYRLLIQNGNKKSREAGEKLIRRVYSLPEGNDWLRRALESSPAFERKIQADTRDIWVYASRKEEFVFPALDNALLELHEVAGEVILEEDRAVIEILAEHAEEVAASLCLPYPSDEREVDRLTSTGVKLTRGTIFVTSQPSLPPKVLQWAVQTYFTELWLVSPHALLNQLPPILAAASDDAVLRSRVKNLVAVMQAESGKGGGAARFINIERLKNRLAQPTQSFSIYNLLKRPVIEGQPGAGYTVSSSRLDEITRFVAEMTEGKSEATVKKYDEVMSLFRTFVRGAFGPSFRWEDLRDEEVAYFLAHDVVNRVSAPTKTLASNLLSVLSSFFRWLDKQSGTSLTVRFQPLLQELKVDLAEAYRMRAALQKQAGEQLRHPLLKPSRVKEVQALLTAKREGKWLVRTSDGSELLLVLPVEAEIGLSPDWILSGLVGQTKDGQWRLLGGPELYPPAVSRLVTNETVSMV